MEKEERYLITFVMLVCPAIFLCLVLLWSGVATPFIPCFAVDGANRIYVGTEYEIRVYQNGTLCNTINPKTSRAYMFTIKEDDTILLSTASKAYVMDLEGNVLSVEDDPGADVYNQIQYKRHRFISQSDEYRLVSTLGWTRIVKNGTETVYQISLLSFVVKILLAVYVIAMVWFPLWMIKQKRKNKQLGQGTGSRISSETDSTDPR